MTLFAVTLVEGAAEQRLVKIQAPPLAEGQRLRIDGGAGQVRQFGGEPGQSISAEILLSYPKPGRYTVGLDLLDGEGFCIAALAQTDLEIADASAADDAPAVAEEPRFAPDERGPEESPSLAAPWLPYRNFKSKPGGARTYSSAGGGTVRRWVGTGTWMSVRRETVAGGARWYQTAGGDWIKADAVVFFEPSPLRGVELAATQPPPPPPPPPPGNRKGVVTASTLNVRARPGVSASNPPVGSLRAGAQVVIFEEKQAGGENWYRIGVDRWVAARYVRLVESRGAESEETRWLAANAALPLGWVVPDKLDVRAKPGVAAGNPVIDQLDHNTRVPDSRRGNGQRRAVVPDGRTAMGGGPAGGGGPAQAKAGQYSGQLALGGGEPVAADGGVLRRRSAGLRRAQSRAGCRVRPRCRASSAPGGGWRRARCQVRDTTSRT